MKQLNHSHFGISYQPPLSPADHKRVLEGHEPLYSRRIVRAQRDSPAEAWNPRTYPPKPIPHKD